MICGEKMESVIEYKLQIRILRRFKIMKNTKTCSKCGGNDIVVVSNDGHPDATYGNNIQTGMTILSGSIYVKRYICCGCGFSEEWIDQSDIATLKKSKKIKQM